MAATAPATSPDAEPRAVSDAIGTKAEMVGGYGRNEPFDEQFAGRGVWSSELALASSRCV